MTRAISDILQFVEENDIKFIRLAFCDMFGVQKTLRFCRLTLSTPLRTAFPSTPLLSADSAT